MVEKMTCGRGLIYDTQGYHALTVIPYSDNPDLCENIASYLGFKGEYRAAERHLVRCLEILKRASSDALTVTESLAGAYSAQDE